MQNGYFPAEMLMGRQPRADFPTNPRTLIPHTPDHDVITIKEHEYKAKAKHSYDNCQTVKELLELKMGDPLYVRDLNRPSTVTENLPGRSHIIGNSIRTIRRNRCSLPALSS